MALDKDQFRFAVSEVLKTGQQYSLAAVNLLLGTAAVESNFGTYLFQKNGPALGVFQMEPATHNDIWKNYLAGRQWLIDDFNLKKCIGRLIYDLRYSVAMTRIHYLRVPKLLPDHKDINGMAKYWKKYYNTNLGRGSIKDFVDKYALYVL